MIEERGGEENERRSKGDSGMRDGRMVEGSRKERGARGRKGR